MTKEEIIKQQITRIRYVDGGIEYKGDNLVGRLIPSVDIDVDKLVDFLARNINEIVGYNKYIATSEKLYTYEPGTGKLIEASERCVAGNSGKCIYCGK